MSHGVKVVFGYSYSAPHVQEYIVYIRQYLVWSETFGDQSRLARTAVTHPWHGTLGDCYSGIAGGGGGRGHGEARWFWRAVHQKAYVMP